MELLGVADIAALIDEPEHMVSVACSRFATFIPMVRIGRDRWYPPEAVPVLRVIFDQIRVGVPDEHIETILTKRFPVTRIASQDLTGPVEAAPPQAAANARTEQVRDVFDRYQSAIQNEMLQMRRELAQIAPEPAPAPQPPRPDLSLSELARQERGGHYLDPRQYGYTHLADLPRAAAPTPQPSIPAMPRPEYTEPRASEDDFDPGLDEETKVLITAISRQAAASEAATLRHEVEGIRGDLAALMEQFRSFSQQLGVYQQEARERPRVMATGTNGATPHTPSTRLEVVPPERERERPAPTAPYTPATPAAANGSGEGNGLLNQLSRRSPRRMGKTLLGHDEHA